MLNIGLIGAGRIGQLHARNIVQHVNHATLTSITDVSAEAANALASDLGISNVAGSHVALLTDSSIDAVLICSSTDTHAQFIIDAARAGKHIIKTALLHKSEIMVNA